MQSGQLKHSIQIYRPTETIDDFGTSLTTYTLITSCRASVSDGRQYRQIVNDTIYLS